jgi:hypothetical protein
MTIFAIRNENKRDADVRRTDGGRIRRGSHSTMFDRTFALAAAALLISSCAATAPSHSSTSTSANAPVTAPAAVVSTPAASTTTTTTPAPTAHEVSAADLVDHAGDSLETAINVPADAPNDGIDFENNWMFDRFGRFRRLRYGLGHAGERHFDVITIELPDHSEHTVHFDVTDVFKAWVPPSKQ